MDLDLPRTVAGLGFLLIAAAMDLRRRRVNDEVWIALGVVALAIVEADLLLANAGWSLHLVPAATAILYFGVFFGKEMWTEEGFRFRPGRFALYLASPLLVILAWRWSADDPTSLGAFYRILTMPALILVAHGLYEFGLLRGGADAKAFMSLGLLFPGVYPHVGPLPWLAPSPLVEPVLAVWFPFAFVVLVNAAILFAVAPLWFLARNAASGDAKFPQALLGYRAPLDGLPRFAWLMDRVEGGEHVTVVFPRRREDRDEQVRLLKERGLREAWITPQLPFLVAIAAGFALAVTVGNVLLLPFGGLRP